MFTGIVTAIGTIREASQRGDLHAVIACPWDPAGIAIGASIACSGTCLTVVQRGETVARTAANRWTAGTALNLEPALRLGDELGGHIVTGHVDAVGTVVGICPAGDSHRVGISAPRELAPYIAAKGSITVDGVSLTVNEVADQPDGTCHFALNIIPHTWDVTTLGTLAAGSQVNLEIDVLARYLQRMNSLRG